MDLTTFLLERVAEDEAVARAASPGGWTYGDVESVAGGSLYDETRMIGSLHYEQPEDHDGTIVRHLLAPEADANGDHIARHDPVRVLAQCEAVRRVVALHDVGDHSCEGTDVTTWVAPCDTLLALAAIYADHPDFDPAWRAEVGA
jgi:hypothetical protein